MKFLISTPLRVFVFDADGGTTTDLVAGGGEYYGVTWHDDALLVSCSRTNSDRLFTRGYPTTRLGDVLSIGPSGDVPARTPRRILLGHQIEWAGDRLLVADTGHDRISAYDRDGTLIADHALGGTGRDLREDGSRGRHFNSVHRRGDRVWVVAHNFDDPSAVWELTWPELEVVTVRSTAASWAHNVWDGEHGLVICDSQSGGLLAAGGETLWRAADRDVVTRGLSVGACHVAVGRSAVGPRASRLTSDGGLWILDRSDMTLVESFVFPGSGAVHEVRLLDIVDECHSGALPPAGVLDGLPAAAATLGASVPQPVHASAAPVRRRVAGRGRGVTATDDLPAAIEALETGAAAVRRRAEALTASVDVLVWMPYVNPGGGARLILSLLPPLARSPGIRSVRFAVPKGCVARHEWPLLAEAGVAVIELGARSRDGVRCAWFQKDGNEVFGIDGDEQWYRETVGALADECDVVYVPWPHRNSVPDIGAPLVCTVQDTTLIDFPEGLGYEEAQEERALTGRWVHRSAAVIVSSRNTRGCLTRLLGEAGTRARVIAHAIRPRPEVGDVPLPDAVRDRLPDRYVICATNVSPHKNLDLLLHAWARFEHRAQWPLLLIGYGTEVLDSDAPPSYANWRVTQLGGVARRLDLRRETGVHALGYVPDAWVRPLIGGAAALVMPSVTEGGGSFPVEEALSLGVPVLCSDIPVMREHLEHRTADAGWFDPWSAGSIVQAARDLVADYDARLAAARLGQLDPRPEWADVADAYAEVLCEVAGGAR